MTSCPLCLAHSTEYFHRDKYRSYRQCPECRLIYVPATYHLSAEEEKRQYDLHQNSPEDQRYRQFLNRLFEPMISRLSAGAEGLDFGSGPGPTLSVMFEEVGHPMAIYDIFYAPDRSTIDRQYDFVTATEVVEHLSRPGTDLERLWSLVAPGGWLGIMTRLTAGRQAFSSWHYKNDPTHISFFCKDTFRWLGRKWGCAPLFVGQDVILFCKNMAL